VGTAVPDHSGAVRAVSGKCHRNRSDGEDASQDTGQGLYLSGHGTQPGGVYGVVAFGLQTAQTAAGYETMVDFLGALQGSAG
jgi:hypothetical protein